MEDDQMPERTTATPAKRRVLWVENDGPSRFVWEERQLHESGWTIAWALTIEQAIDQLAVQSFDAIILDQFLPYTSSDPDARMVVDGPPQAWGGCVLLWWLRRMAPPKDLPRELGDEWKKRREGWPSPLPCNTDISATVASDYDYDEIRKSLQAASLKGLDTELEVLPKPIETDALLAFLRTAVGETA